VLADGFEFGVDVLQRIGGVFDVGGVEVEQHVLAVGHVAGLDARAQALQAEDRQFLVAHENRMLLCRMKATATLRDSSSLSSRKSECRWTFRRCPRHRSAPRCSSAGR
jgi:hypothetical protein